jgi:Outer membrane protein beta-barrel domain
VKTIVKKTTAKTSSLFILAVLVGLMTASISQAYQLSIVGTGTDQKFNYSGAASGTNPSSSASMGYGAGILIDHHFDRGVGIQFGLLYLNQKQNITALSVTDTLQRKLVQVPVTLQFHLLPGLTIGAGGYYSHTIGDNSVTDSSGNVTDESDNAEQLKSYDLGAVGGVALHLPLTQSCHFLADARYLQSFTNQDTSGTVTTKPSGFQFMVGLTFGMMGGRSY